jgi:2-desacetyl-2-hydroxyethyl bacteriochlorophyllide A dehydrogenase
MKALAVLPGKANSIHLHEVDEPEVGKLDLLCEMMMIGVCGTDFEISRGEYGEAPAGSPFLILGHESLGRVLEAPLDSGFSKGDLVVGFVRRPDPVPCANCAKGEWDMCRNGQYTERGIKGLHGYSSERYRVEAKYAVKLDPKLKTVGVLLEPTSVVAKAWEHIEKMSARSAVPPRRALITGAGPVGLLAAMIGVQRGLEIHVLDRVTDGPKPELVRALGATYHSDLKTLQESKIEFDLTLECTGVPELILDLFNQISADGILCLAGVSSGGRNFPTDIGALNRNIVLQNEIIFGSVNANRRHYEAAAVALAKADLGWLEKMITRRVPLAKWEEAFKKLPTDIKVVLTP